MAHPSAIVLVSEALHEKQIADIADDIVARNRARAAGADRRAVVLRQDHLCAPPGRPADGQWPAPLPLGLDDYFVDRERTPRDEQGDYDFEALEAVDLALFNQQLLALMAGERGAHAAL